MTWSIGKKYNLSVSSWCGQWWSKPLYIIWINLQVIWVWDDAPFGFIGSRLPFSGTNWPSFSGFILCFNFMPIILFKLLEVDTFICINIKWICYTQDFRKLTFHTLFLISQLYNFTGYGHNRATTIDTTQVCGKFTISLVFTNKLHGLPL